MQRREFVLYVGPVAAYLRGQLLLMGGLSDELEIDYNECLDIVRDSFVVYVFGQGGNSFVTMTNPIAEQWEYLNISQAQFDWLLNSIYDQFSYHIAVTIGSIDPDEYVDVNWCAPDTGIISQTIGKAYYNERINEHTQHFSETDMATRYY